MYIKKFLAMVLVLLLFGSCALADQTDTDAGQDETAQTDTAAQQDDTQDEEAAEDAATETRVSYNVEELGIRLYVDDEWVDYAYDGDITLWYDVAYDDDERLTQGYIALLPSEYASEDDMDAKGVIMAVVVNAEGVEQNMLEIVDSYEESGLDTVEGYTFTLYMNTAPDVSLLDEDGVAMVELISGMLAGDMESHLKLSEPLIYSGLGQVIGDFNSQDIYGNAMDSSILANAPYTLIDVWATFCSPCISEMPELAELAGEYEGRVQFVGIVSDAYDEDTIELARSIVEQTGVKYTCIVPDSSLESTLLNHIQYVPTKIVVDQQGQQIGELIIGAQDMDALREILDALPEAE